MSYSPRANYAAVFVTPWTVAQIAQNVTAGGVYGFPETAQTQAISAGIGDHVLLTDTTQSAVVLAVIVGATATTIYVRVGE